MQQRFLLEELFDDTIAHTSIQQHELLDRIDTKYLLSTSQLRQISTCLTDHYQIVTHHGHMSSRCHNHYFDTSDLLFYNDHHNGKRNRQKVRIRHYINSNLSYIEIKQRVNHRRTIKHRRVASQPIGAKECERFLTEKIHTTDHLFPSLFNSFNRTTLANKSKIERVTIDQEISMSLDRRNIRFNHLVVLEVKSSHDKKNSAIYSLMKQHGIRPLSISKYCTGISMLRQDVKYNLFKEATRKIMKIEGWR